MFPGIVVGISIGISTTGDSVSFSVVSSPSVTFKVFVIFEVVVGDSVVAFPGTLVSGAPV